MIFPRARIARVWSGAAAFGALLISGAMVLPGSLQAAEATELPTSEQIEDVAPEGTRLTGREIWEKYLKNRIHQAVQKQTVISTDPGGDEQKSRFWVRYKDYREIEDSEGVIAKTLVKFQHPNDLRHTGFLMILKDDKTSQQWVYRPSTRKVRRVRLDGVSVAGSDFTFDDIAYRDIEESDYLRMPNEEIDGVTVYVVEATVKPFVDSPYSKIIT